MQLKIVDSLVVNDHYHIQLPEDECYYFMEYTAYAGYTHSDANDIIQNLKKPVSRKGRPEYKWKGWGIKRVSTIFTESLTVPAGDWTLIPLPPSKTRQHPEYDDRMWQVLQQVGQQQGCDIRDILSCRQDRQAAHTGNDRRDIPTLQANLQLDMAAAQNLAPNIALVDDVLSTGAQFKAAKSLLLSHFPHLRVVGIFAARRAIIAPAIDFSQIDFENL